MWFRWLGVVQQSKKVAGSNLSQGTCLGCGLVPNRCVVQEATDQFFSLTLMFLSLSFSLSKYKILKKIKFHCKCVYSLLFKKRFYLFIFRVGEERQRNTNAQEHRLVASPMPPTGHLAHNPGMCPDQELNPQPFALWQPTEPHWSGL